MSAPTLFVIAKDLTEMQVNASIDESDIGRIKAGQTVTFRVDAYPRDTFTGTVSQVRLEPVVAAERRQLRDGHRRAEPRAEAEAGHDGERHRRNRARRRRAARAQRGAALPAAAATRDAAVAAAAAAARSATRAAARVGACATGNCSRSASRPGISDGTTTAIVDGALAENAQVVTGRRGASAPTAAAPAVVAAAARQPAGRQAAGAGAARQGAGR